MVKVRVKTDEKPQVKEEVKEVPKVKEEPRKKSKKKSKIHVSPIQIDRGLVSKILETKDMVTIEDYQIRSSFLEGEHKQVYEYIMEFYREHGEVPSERLILSEYPYYEFDTYVDEEGYETVGNKEPLGYWCEEVRLKKKHNTIAAGIESVAQTMDSLDTETAYRQIRKLIVDVETDIEISHTINIKENTDARKERYKFRKENQGMIGIPIGIDKLDYTLKGLQAKQLITMIAGTGVGKAHTLDTKVLTPFGYKEIREINVGDYVVGEKGGPVKVIGTYPQGMKDIYEITFCNNTTNKCCKEHLWKYREVGTKEWKVDALENIMKIENKVEIPTSPRVYFIEQAIEEEPTEVGIHCYKEDIEVPEEYLVNTIAVREDLAYGMIKSADMIAFDKTSHFILDVAGKERVLDSLIFLINSLGAKTEIRDERLIVYLPQRNTVQIKSIKKIGRDQAKCIAVDSKEHTYIVDGFIITHNTWFQVITGANAMLENYKVLQIVTEMSEEQMQDRYDAYLYGALKGDFSYERFKSGRLYPQEEKDYFDFLDNTLPNLSDLWIDSANNVSGIRALIQKYEPDLVLVDGVYLMEDEQGAKDDWLRIAHITRDLKALAKDEEIPIFINSQADQNTSEKTGPGLSNFSYSSSIGQDSDVVLALFRDKEMIEDREMQVKVLKQREGTLVNVMMEWDFATMTFDSIYASVDESQRLADNEEDKIDIRASIGV